MLAEDDGDHRGGREHDAMDEDSDADEDADSADGEGGVWVSVPASSARRASACSRCMYSSRWSVPPELRSTRHRRVQTVSLVWR